jgi:hypothetical protein
MITYDYDSSENVMLRHVATISLSLTKCYFESGMKRCFSLIANEEKNEGLNIRNIC